MLGWLRDAEVAQKRMNTQLAFRLEVPAARAKPIEKVDERDGENLTTVVHELDLEESRSALRWARTRLNTRKPASLPLPMAVGVLPRTIGRPARTGRTAVH